MNFDHDTRDDAALGGAEALCRDALPALPADAHDFFRGAHAAFEARGSFALDSVEIAARVAMLLGAASGSFASVFVSGFAFARARRTDGAAAPVLVSATDGDGTVGVLAEVGPEASLASDGKTLSGVASFVMGGPVATHAVVIGGSTDGFPALACVDLAARGVSRQPAVRAPGFDRVPACAIHFDGVSFTPSSARDREVASTFVRNARRTLEAAVGVGIGRHTFQVAIEHLRSLGARPPQSTEFSLSDVATDLDAAELSVLRAAWGVDRGSQGSQSALESASAKLLAARAALRAAHSALVLVGNTGYKDQLGECCLDAGALAHYDETSAKQVDTIASEMLRES